MKPLFPSVLAAALLFAGCSTRSQVAMYPASGSENVNPDTHLVLVFRQTPVVGKSGWIRIFDAESGKMVDSLDMSVPAGPTRSRKYGPECDYTKVPYDYSRTEMATNRNTVPGTPSGTAEPTPRDFQLTIIGGFSDGFHFHPIIVHDSIATIYPHNNLLEYGKSYYVTMDDGVLNLPDSSFHGIQGKRSWRFSTKKAGPDLSVTRQLLVDAQGNGDFNTVQGALDYIPDFSEEPIEILVQPGDYEEIVYARNKSCLTIAGAGMDRTKVHYANNEVFNPHPMLVKTNEMPGTFPSRRAAFMLDNCHDIVLKDLCIATDLFGQAEGILLNGERIEMYRVHIIGSGDAIQANGSIYMEACELDGGGDTFLGRGAVFGYRCHFRNDGGPFSYVRNTKESHGDVFVECSFSGKPHRPADFGRTSQNHGKYYPDAEFVVIDCMTEHFHPAGWSAIGTKTEKMLEFNTRDLRSGEPVDVSRRHPYSRRLDAVKDAETIANYRNPSFVLGWMPCGESRSK